MRGPSSYPREGVHGAIGRADGLSGSLTVTYHRRHRARRDARKAGQEAVRGASATRCSGTVDVAEPTARDESGTAASDSTVCSGDHATEVPVERPRADDAVDFLDVVERQSGSTLLTCG
ncbi:hypothetical protein [Streptomyces rhizosphaericola]|uniref:Uncharacterized protein n=1 Tax=Streptomyces rhizosphaericola TaxID=2564098 RepID=A0ABY2PHS0_9ACTN|nr:hypothetical protein [Streptomyces rhizosphaericola]TGZ10625.1 hypothetical protein E5Z02_08940 [Streptomyces rhizosphaericola]